MSELTKLPNIGKVLADQLMQVGVESYEQLQQIGSKQVWLNIKSIDPSACYNRLCALEGAIQGIRWHYLSEEVKAELKEFYRNIENTLK